MSHEPQSPRAARLAEIRRRMAAGTYDSPVRLEAAIEAFLDSPDARVTHETSLRPPGGDSREFTAR